MRTVWWLIGLAAVCWFVMFAPWTKGYVNFWAAMLCSTIVLGGTVLWLGRSDPQQRASYAFRPVHVLYGLGAVAFLYSFFWAGKYLATTVLPFAAGQIQNVYATKSQAPPWLIAVLLLGWIGPAEEIFWRGYVQRQMVKQYGIWPGLIATTAIYALVHVWSGNFMLVMAAAIAGAFWGLLFQRTKSIWPGIISHALWDALIFVWAPL